MKYPLFSSAKLTKIPYFTQPPALGGQLSYLSPTELSTKLHCDFSEEIWIEEEIKDRLQFNNYRLKQDGIISGITPDALIQGIKTIKQGRNKQLLAIANMNETVGHGVFALADIPKHTVLCLYAGEVKLGTNVIDPNTNDLIFYTGNFRIEAWEKRGIASFMQHLPADSRPFGSKRADIATTNVMSEFVIIDGIPMVALVSLRDIKAYEQVGFSYGAYWLTRQIPCLFNHQGEPLATNLFNPQQIRQSFGFDKTSCCFQHAISFASTLTQVNIVNDSRQTLVTIYSTNYQALNSWQMTIGSPQIAKQKQAPVFELRRSWLKLLNEHNPRGFSEIATVLGLSTELLQQELKLVSPNSNQPASFFNPAPPITDIHSLETNPRFKVNP